MCDGTSPEPRANVTDEFEPLQWREVPRSSENVVQLNYSIEEYSSFSANYFANNILVNSKTDQSSRWSSASNNNSQFITLMLEHVAILQTITFGKFHKVHVCNLKEFKVYAGLTKDTMSEILHSGLRNDTENETFAVKYATKGVVFPVKYVKIVPIAAWGQNFNFSIWYVELCGCNNALLVKRALFGISKAKEAAAVKACMKFLRKKKYVSSFNALREESGFVLEDAFLSNLYNLLVANEASNGDAKGVFSQIEACISQLDDGIFAEYILNSCKYTPIWTEILAPKSSSKPSCRGGHQMCIDAETQTIYLFGGWNGNCDLDDLWKFDIASSSWTCIHEKASEFGGPTPRSCHKMAFHPARRTIYLLGKYIDTDARLNGTFSCDFYAFDLERCKWSKISEDTKSEGGPSLLYDHQMVIDTFDDRIVIFGGKSVESGTSELEYSGMYFYDIANNQWSSPMNVESNSVDCSACTFQSRIGHSMMIDECDDEIKSPVIYIFAGQRYKDYLADFIAYDLRANAVIKMHKDVSRLNGPESGFTQRASIDPISKEIFVMSGLTREKSALLSNSTANGAGPTEATRNQLWCYSIRNDSWTKICQSPYNSSMQEPCPRYAYQFCYDSKQKKHFLFGGNPGESGNPRQRLADFWELKLEKPGAVEIKGKIKFLLKRQQYYELISQGNSMAALEFLQNELHASVNHADERESESFKRLARALFEPLAVGEFSIVESRQALYESILEFFPESMKQPKQDLVNLIEF